MNTENILDKAIKNSEKNIKVNHEDYIGENGLLFCGKCHTAKQVRIPFQGGIRTPRCICKCEQEERDRREEELKRIDLALKIKRNRNAGFADKSMMQWTFANDDGENEKLTNAMQNYVNNFPEFRKAMKGQHNGLLLYGEVGRGKTFAACEVANALIDKGYFVLVTNFARLSNTIQGMYEGKQKYIDSLNRYELLVIDDLGAERKREFMKEMVYNIIDSRYRSGLPMIITTNLSMDEIKNPGNMEYERIYDRILERCFPIKVEGTSKRRKAIRNSYDDMKNKLGL